MILVTAAADHIPEPLVDQLARGGHLVLPVGSDDQRLWVVEKQQDGNILQREITPVAFVPMTGFAQQKS